LAISPLLTMNAPRYPQFRHSQIDQRFGRPEAHKRLVDRHLGQDRTPRFALLTLDLGFFLEPKTRLGVFCPFLNLVSFALIGLPTVLATCRMLLPLKWYVYFPSIKFNMGLTMLRIRHAYNLLRLNIQYIVQTMRKRFT
jgi:hypothetical protein